MPTKSKRKPAARKPRPKLTDAKLNAMKLHELMAVAMRDTRKQERAKHSRVDMCVWLDPGNGEPCKACFAGSVMRHSLNMCWMVLDTSPIQRWATALNYLRWGYVGYALHKLGRHPEEKHSLDRWVPDYDDDRRGWWAAMRRLHADLKEADL